MTFESILLNVTYSDGGKRLYYVLSTDRLTNFICEEHLRRALEAHLSGKRARVHDLYEYEYVLYCNKDHIHICEDKWGEFPLDGLREVYPIESVNVHPTIQHVVNIKNSGTYVPYRKDSRKVLNESHA
jgi:hypothetical protein